MVGKPSRMYGSGREALKDAWGWLGGPFRSQGVVERPSRMSMSGWQTLPDVREWSEDPVEGP